MSQIHPISPDATLNQLVAADPRLPPMQPTARPAR